MLSPWASLLLVTLRMPMVPIVVTFNAILATFVDYIASRLVLGRSARFVVPVVNLVLVPLLAHIPALPLLMVPITILPLCVGNFLSITLYTGLVC